MNVSADDSGADDGAPDDGGLLARLQAADPAKRTPVPSDDWISDLTEATMTDIDETRPDRGSRRPWLLVAAAAVVVGALGIGGVAAMNGGDGDKAPPAANESTVTRLQGPPQTAAKCMVPSAEVLAASAQTAFDGTVLSIEGDQVTLDATHWYAGAATAQVVVTAPSADMAALIGAVELKEGERYLVAGTSDGQLMVCGFSAPYTAGLAAMYATAFGQ
jgi:hypothetical protein